MFNLHPNSHVCLQVPSLIPVLLFKLGKEKNPGLAHAVLNCLPNLGTHKVLGTSGLNCLYNEDVMTYIPLHVLWRPPFCRSY